MLNTLHHASAHVIAIVSLSTGHAATLSVKLGTGSVGSILYCPFRVLVFPAQSLVHKYNILSHADGVIILPLVNVVPALVQSPALIQLYFAVLKFVSLTLNVTNGAVLTRLLELLFALTLGDILSYVVLIIFDTAFGFVD